MACLDWRVGSENALLPHRPYIVGEFSGSGVFRAWMLAQECERQECGVPLVEVVCPDLEPKRQQNAFGANTEDDFLFETILVIAAIKPIGDGAILRIVLLHIRVEQQNRHRIAMG